MVSGEVFFGLARTLDDDETMTTSPPAGAIADPMKTRSSEDVHTIAGPPRA